MAQRDRRGYIICSTQRSGSSMLCHLLRQTGVLGKPGESFVEKRLTRGNDDARSDVEKLEAMIDQVSTKNGVFGTKLHYHQFEQLIERTPLRTFGGFDGWVYIDREDEVGQAVSLARAWQTNSFSWEQAERKEPTYDAAQIDKALSALRAEKVAWNRYFDTNGIVPIQIVYEKTLADPNTAVEAVCALMGVDPVQVDLAKVKTKVQRDAVNDEWAQRYRSR